MQISCNSNTELCVSFDSYLMIEKKFQFNKREFLTVPLSRHLSAEKMWQCRLLLRMKLHEHTGRPRCCLFQFWLPKYLFQTVQYFLQIMQIIESFAQAGAGRHFSEIKHRPANFPISSFPQDIDIGLTSSLKTCIFRFFQCDLFCS